MLSTRARVPRVTRSPRTERELCRRRIQERRSHRGSGARASISSTTRRLGNAEVKANVAHVFAEIGRQCARDIPIRESKAHLRAPSRCDGDGPIGLLGQRAMQRYRANAAGG